VIARRGGRCVYADVDRVCADVGGGPRSERQRANVPTANSVCPKKNDWGKMRTAEVVVTAKVKAGKERRPREVS
jgi:hypothetical protein